jgi:hypothetical protein
LSYQVAERVVPTAAARPGGPITFVAYGLDAADPGATDVYAIPARGVVTRDLGNRQLVKSRDVV